MLSLIYFSTFNYEETAQPILVNQHDFQISFGMFLNFENRFSIFCDKVHKIDCNYLLLPKKRLG